MGSLDIWNLERSTSIFHISNAHKNVINCISAVGLEQQSAPEIVTGGRDGTTPMRKTTKISPSIPRIFFGDLREASSMLTPARL